MVKNHIKGFWKWFWIAMAGIILAAIWYFVITFGLSSYYEKQGNSNYHKEKYERAIDAYETAITFTPNTARLYNSLGYTHYMLYEDEKAINAYNHALELEPESVDVNYNLGLLYYEKKEYKKSLNYYNRVLEIKPNDSETLYMVGMLYVEQDNFKEAIKNYEKLIISDPKHPYVYNALANAYSSISENEKAKALYLKHIEMFPEDYIGYTNLYELQLTANKLFDEELKVVYISSFKEDKNAFIAYEMLKILEDISKGKKIDMELWKEKYKEISFGEWRFNKLDTWVDSFEESQRKDKLKEALEIFKSHKVEKN